MLRKRSLSNEERKLTAAHIEALRNLRRADYSYEKIHQLTGWSDATIAKYTKDVRPKTQSGPQTQTTHPTVQPPAISVPHQPKLVIDLGPRQPANPQATTSTPSSGRMWYNSFPTIPFGSVNPALQAPRPPQKPWNLKTALAAVRESYVEEYVEGLKLRATTRACQPENVEDIDRVYSEEMERGIAEMPPWFQRVAEKLLQTNHLRRRLR